MLKTKRLTLRAPKHSDAEDLFEVFGHRETMKYWSTVPDATLEETAKRVADMIARTEIVRYFVIEYEGHAVGTVGNFHDTEVGYILNHKHWRKGLMREAFSAVITYLWEVTEHPELTADIDPDNIASRGLLSALGFKETHRAKNTFCIDGVWTDSVYFALPRPS